MSRLAEHVMGPVLRPQVEQYGSHLLRYTPERDAYPGSDLRRKVIVGEAGSGVANRYATHGCTVNDLIRDDVDWDGAGAFMAHVAHVTGELVRTKVLTDAEKDAIVDAATRSGFGR
ncbi:hypothetical protein OHA25_05065 [Nonomuraea sp. NBC_00507]|uniref:hypothetical protein n=1 Tax=Nonomuraea sp. NBC_00507 TaxID=2976002 RepID=UPI002E16CAE1